MLLFLSPLKQPASPSVHSHLHFQDMLAFWLILINLQLPPVSTNISHECSVLPGFNLGSVWLVSCSDHCYPQQWKLTSCHFLFSSRFLLSTSSTSTSTSTPNFFLFLPFLYYCLSFFFFATHTGTSRDINTVLLLLYRY